MLTTLLLLAVLLQYRHGNRVIARAQRSPGREALTGLLNRERFERTLAKLIKLPKLAKLAKLAKSAKVDKLARQAIGTKPRASTALFLHIADSDRDALAQRFDGEGFESGMVQIAAALSSSIPVVDTVARISTNAFGVLPEMPFEKIQLEKSHLKANTVRRWLKKSSAVSWRSAATAHPWHKPRESHWLGCWSMASCSANSSGQPGKCCKKWTTQSGQPGWAGWIQTRTAHPAQNLAPTSCTA